MCDKCYVLKGLFKAAKSDSHSNYIPTLTFINEIIQQGRLELFAGDCQLEETKKYLDKETHYTVCHYFRCKSCNQYFFIGACIRGTPIYKTTKSLVDKDIDKILWGHCETLYEKNYKKLEAPIGKYQENN